MYDFRDPSGRGRAAIIAVLVWIVADCAYTIGSALVIAVLNGAGPPPATVDAFVRAVSIVQLLATLCSVVFVARWIMRVSPIG